MEWLKRLQQIGIVPLDNVDSSTLKRVIEWAEHHKNDSPPQENDAECKERNMDYISEWDQNVGSKKL